MRTKDGRLIKWQEVGSGAYNKTYISEEPFEWDVKGISYTQRWVLKIPKKDKDELAAAMNCPERAVRIWNAFNPNHPAVEVPNQGGWLMPYLGRQQSNDKAVAEEQIRLYRESRRIVADACGQGNFLTYQDKSYCVDVDAAMYVSSPTSQKIKDELVSFDGRNSDYPDYWSLHAIALDMPETVAVVKTLLYLESQLSPESIDNKYITKDVIYGLHFYRLLECEINRETLVALLTKPITNRRRHEIATLLSLENQLFSFAIPVTRITPTILQSMTRSHIKGESVASVLYAHLLGFKKDELYLAKNTLDFIQRQFNAKLTQLDRKFSKGMKGLHGGHFICQLLNTRGEVLSKEGFINESYKLFSIFLIKLKPHMVVHVYRKFFLSNKSMSFHDFSELFYSNIPTVSHQETRTIRKRPSVSQPWSISNLLSWIPNFIWGRAVEDEPMTVRKMDIDMDASKERREPSQYRLLA